MVDGWISCNQCGHRHGSFMSSCPKCGHIRTSTFSYPGGAENASKSRPVGKGGIIVIAIIVVGGTVSVLLFLDLDLLPFIQNQANDNNSLEL